LQACIAQRAGRSARTAEKRAGCCTAGYTESAEASCLRPRTARAIAASPFAEDSR
jgi:hypothetical protein